MRCLIHLLLACLLWVPQGALAQCNPATSTAEPRVGVVDWPSTAGTSCYFPFSYGGVTYDDCDGSYCDDTFCGYWCATSCNYESDYFLWRFCKFFKADLARPNCSGLANVSASTEIEVYGGVGTRATCYFPFLYNGVCYDDCIVTTGGGSPWCATTDVMYQVSSDQRFCRATRKGLRDPSCASLNSSAPVQLPQQVGNYSMALVQSDPTGNCTFPFYYKEKCYDDCTTVDAQAWNLPWCQTEKFNDPNKRTRVCPHYRRYKDIGGLALSWGFYSARLQDGCATGDASCNATWLLGADSAGTERMVLSSSAAQFEPIEVMPQPNGFFILKLPRNCSTNWKCVSVDGTADVGIRSITIEREFWDIRATATPGVFTVQSTRNSSRAKYLSYSVSSAKLVLTLSSDNATRWRFDQLGDVSMATLGLPCDRPIALNGSWCAWSAYVPSGSGEASRNRTCACPPALNGGLPCNGNASETAVVVNGTWCAWSAFDIGGGDGYGRRTRECNCSAPVFGGASCPGSGNDTGSTVNGTWCSWSPFIVSGPLGSRTRQCNCSEPAYGGADCPGAGNETGPLVNGSWCDWSPFRAVGDGNSSRTRACNCSAPAFGGADCSGAAQESGPLVNGSWCDWSPFSVSSSLASRTRKCNCSAPAFGGADCPGVSNETGMLVNGSWCDWSAYTTGADGIRRRTRECNCSAPAFGGAACPGSGNDTEVVAAVNGTWCDWSSYSILDSSHGIRRRTCNCSAPSLGGADCPGSSVDVGITVNGAWCEWSGLSGNGTHETRRRLCNCSSPAYGGSDCSASGGGGDQTETSVIVAGVWCTWSAWTSSTAVGGGINVTRSRACACPSRSSLGTDCSGPTAESGGCGAAGNCSPSGIFAVPKEPGEAGAPLTSLDIYRRLVAWTSVISVSMIASLIIGVGLMLHHVRYVASAVGVDVDVTKP